MEDTEYKQLDPVSHMLANPERDLGDCTMRVVNRHLLNLDTMVLVESKVIYNTGIERLFLEILYNAADNVERSRLNGIDPGIIRVSMSSDTIQVYNEGRPISCAIQAKETVHIPEFIFGRLLSGSSFLDGNKKRKVETIGGRFGIGATATNIFSTCFIIEIGNAIEKVQYKQIWKNNMSICTPPVIRQDYKGKSYTRVTFLLDFARFYDDDLIYNFQGRREYMPNVLNIYAKHCADVSITSRIQVQYNNVLIECTELEKYASLYFPGNKTYLILQSEDSLCMILDTPNAGQTISFVNSVFNEEGGIHVNTWRKALFSPIISSIKSKLKGIKLADKDIANHISMILICRLSNPKFKAQTKDKVTSPAPKVSLFDREGLPVNLTGTLQWNAIKHIEGLLASQLAALAKKSDGKMAKIADCEKLVDAFHAGGRQSSACTLIITEGDSASNVVAKSMNDGYVGTLPIKGKILNVGKATQKLDLDGSSSINVSKDKYTKNSEIYQIKHALGLKEGIDYTSNEARDHLRYGKLVILSDQDVDGAHIRMLVINLFRWKFPSLLQCGYIQIMETPLLRILYDRRTLIFFYQKEYDMWINSPLINSTERDRRMKATVDRYKGLGSSTDSQVLDFFKMKKVLVPKWDDRAEDLMSIAFDKGKEDERKGWISSWDTINNEGKYAKLYPKDTISHLVTNQLCEFAYTNVQRSLPLISDGLKQCQRKVLTVIFNISKKMKVSQLKGLISHDMDYHYGDDALYRTIVNMGNYCVGTNNVPLIKAIGQYDSRLGKKAAADRYIFAMRSPLLKFIFRKEDECILEYLYDGSRKIEPKTYYPIIPPWALNRTEGIGTGWSTKIPAHDPIAIIKYMIWKLKIVTNQVSSDPTKDTFEAPPSIIPFYRNYQGKIVKNGNSWYSIGSYEVISSRKQIKDIIVTEIPVTQTIETYTAKLDILKSTPAYPDWTEKRKCPCLIGNYKLSVKNITFKEHGEEYIEILPYITIEDPLCIVNVGNDNPLRILGLIEKISETNIVLLDQYGKPQQYGGYKRVIIKPNGSTAHIQSGVTNALDAFFNIRYEAYKRRRNIFMKNWKEKIAHLTLKQKFIGDILNKKIRLRDENKKRKSKATLVNEITQLGYPSEFGDISILSLTDDGIEKIQTEIDKFQIKYDHYLRTSPASIWLNELKELYERL